MDSITEESNDNEQVEVRRIPFVSKLAYGVGHVLNDICASMWFTYLLVYFHLVLRFSPAYAGLVLLIGQIADALATPFVGLQSDKEDDFWLCRYGKRKTWHLIGTVCVLSTFPFIFSQCVGCQTAHHWAQLVYYAAFVIIFQFGWASVQISHLSLIPDLSSSEDERTALTAIRYSFTVFSNVLVYCVTWGILHVTSENPDDKIGPKDVHKFQEIVLIGIAVGFIATIIFHLFVKENNAGNTLSVSEEQLERQLKSPFSLFKDPELYQVALIYMPTRLFANLAQTYIPLYLHETLQMPATSLAIIPLIMYLSSFKASLTIQCINAKLGRKMSYLYGALMGIGACIWIWFGKGDQFVKLFIYPVSLLLGSAGSVMIVTSLAITADYIGHSTENGAFVYGIMSFADKLCNGFAVMLIQSIRCTTDCKDYYKEVLVFACGGSAVLGLIMTLSRKSCNYNNSTVASGAGGFLNVQHHENVDNEINESLIENTEEPRIN